MANVCSTVGDQNPVRSRRGLLRLGVAPGLVALAALTLGAYGSSGPTTSAGTAGSQPGAVPSAGTASSPPGAVSSAGTAGSQPGAAPSSAPPSTSSAGIAVASGKPVPPESTPPGDIPDTVAYVPWTSSDHHLRFVHPEGWSQRSIPGGVQFSDKLNSVTVTEASGQPPSVSSVRSMVVPRLGTPGRATRVMSIAPARLPAGIAVHIVWRVNSAPNPVTAKVYRDEVQTYLVGVHGGKVVRMDLSGAVGSDNVDPYRRMSQSLVAP